MSTFNEISTEKHDWNLTSPKRVATTQLPDSPEYVDKYSNTNSDDFQLTSNLNSPYHYQKSRHLQNLTVVGSHENVITLGRGGACTIKIGRRNRQISRIHVSIAFNNEKEQFELTVVGLNGACVDHSKYNQHDVVPLEDNSMVDVLGDMFRFKVPPPPSSVDFVKRLQQQQQQEEDTKPTTPINKNNDFVFRELSPEPEEEYPIELVPEDALSPVQELLSQDEEEVLQDKQNEKESNDNHDYAQVIIDALVFSRTSSMPISEICSRILKSNPAYAKESRQVWTERIRRVLGEKPFFGEIIRKGKTADGSPTENLYYYNSELDPVEWRRATYTQVGRSARKCTLKDKQYFWKIPPKLGRHRNAYIPPSANDLKKHKQDENVDPKDY